jgi:DNA (cytosine-5)-methyltransferase 1
MTRLPARKRPTFASLFSGCGGFDIGFIDAGYRCVGAFDIDPLAVAVHKKNLNGLAQVCDLSESNTAAHHLENVDVLLAGSPCQGFSTAGKRDPADPRNRLLVVAGEIAAAVKPRCFIAENVCGVTAGAQRAYWERLRKILTDSGYKTFDLKLDASCLGLPQTRRRIVMIAFESGIEGPFSLAGQPCRSLVDILSGLDGLPNHIPKALTDRPHLLEIASRIGPGQKLCNVRGGDRSVRTWQIPAVYGSTNVREREILEVTATLRRRNRVRKFGDADPVSVRSLSKHIGSATAVDVEKLIAKGYMRRIGATVDLVHTFNGKCRRLSWSGLAPTVDTRFGDPWYFLHPTDDRGLTVREAARIQGFPDSFIFDGPMRAQYRMVGNAVPPPLATALARVIADRIL